MSLTAAASGTITTDGTEQTLSTQTTIGVYTLALDLSAMVNGDIIEIKLKTKILSGGTSRIAYHFYYAHAQGVPNVYSIAIPADIEIVATIKRLAGADHSYPWSLLRL